MASKQVFISIISRRRRQMYGKEPLRVQRVLGWREAYLSAAAFVVVAAHAGSATGTVNDVQINGVLGGTFLQLNISPTFNYESGCLSPSWAYIPNSDPLYSSFLATMLSAKATGTTITVTTSGCVAVSGSQQPHIASIDYGTRLPGT